ncbi:hypothetical protein HK104_006507 [Borealophlyctis nickersoniae]|nr:hypothetical protein HK104_006507 [Borealophlyctis nickersoniae]
MAVHDEPTVFTPNSENSEFIYEPQDLDPEFHRKLLHDYLRYLDGNMEPECDEYEAMKLLPKLEVIEPLDMMGDLYEELLQERLRGEPVQGERVEEVLDEQGNAHFADATKMQEYMTPWTCVKKQYK